MSPKENLEHDQNFPELELLPEFNVVFDSVKDDVNGLSNCEKQTKQSLSFDEFEFIDINHLTPAEEEKIKREKKINDDFWELVVSNTILLKKYVYFLKRYKEKEILLKLAFIKLSYIANSWIFSKDRIINDIFSYMEIENLWWYKNLLDKLFSNNEKSINRQWFPKEVSSTMFQLISIFDRLFIKKLDHAHEKHIDIWNDAWNWKAR